MKKEQILREELARMRQLMGMNGSLYQKPIMEDESRDEGHGEREPNPRDYKGGERSEAYQKDYTHWSEHQPAPSPPSPPAVSPQPSPPASPPPSPPPAPPPADKIKTDIPSKARPKKGTGSEASGSFVGVAGGYSAKAQSRGSNRFGKRGSKATKGGTKKVTRGKAGKKSKTKKGKKKKED